MRTLVKAAALGIIFGAIVILPSLAIEGDIAPKVTPTPTPTPPPVPEVVPPPPVPKTIVPLPDLKTVLPTVLPNGLIPTDITPVMQMNVLQKSPGLTPEELLAAASSKDERYQFTGVWIAFMEGDESEHASKPLSPVAFVEPVPDKATTEKAVKKFGLVEYIEKHRFNFRDWVDHLFNRSEAVYMPTRNATYSKLAKDNLMVTDGAVLVRAGKIPVTVTTEVNGEKVATKIRGGALAFISAFDKETIVLNLTDNRLSAVVCDVPASSGRKLPVLIPSGQSVEVYPIDNKTVTNLVARRVLVNERTREDIGLLISDTNYIRSMNKFRLTPALPKPDFNRVLKTAAALAYVRRLPVQAATKPQPKKPLVEKNTPETKPVATKQSST